MYEYTVETYKQEHCHLLNIYSNHIIKSRFADKLIVDLTTK